MSEVAIKQSAQLYEMRDTARRLLANDYILKMSEYGDIIKAVQIRDGSDVMGAAIVVAKAAESPIAVLYTMAAAVELIEPSKPN